MGWIGDLWWLVGEVAGLLAVAAIVGLVVGWWLWGRPGRVAERRAAELATEADALAAELVEARRREAELASAGAGTAAGVEELVERLTGVLHELDPASPSEGEPGGPPSG
jgi:hypothetical protein